jgi:hypothetical protein
MAHVGGVEPGRLHRRHAGLLGRHLRPVHIGDVAPVTAGIGRALGGVPAVDDREASRVLDHVPGHGDLVLLAQALVHLDVLDVALERPAFEHVQLHALGDG